LVVFGSGAHWTIVAADGAGGMSGGAAAATEAVVAAAACGSSTSRTAAEWCRFLVELDRELVGQVHTGETTVVVAEVVDGTVHGASVGDSGAWLVSSGEILDLTERQHRKPLVGSGSAHPVPFESRPLTGRLLVATDGLFKYVDRELILESITNPSLEGATRSLIDSARLANGAFRDDIAVVVGESDRSGTRRPCGSSPGR